MNKILIFDTETNGLPIMKGYNNYYNPNNLKYYDNARIIDIAYIIYNEDKSIYKQVQNLVRADDFEVENSHIHGISKELTLEYGRDINKVLDEFYKDLSDVKTIVAHNINFDINVLLSECYRYDNDKLIKKIKEVNKECTMNIGKNYMRSAKNPKLVELYRYLFEEEVKQEHRALSDTILCAKCYHKMML